jgi:quinol monooxygenase YgiN
MNPLLAQIREQLPSEAAPFGLLVRGEVVEQQLSAFTQLAAETQAATRKDPGNIFYFFFFSAKDPLEYVLVETWENFAALAAHFDTAHFERFSQASEFLTGERFSVEVLLGIGNPEATS